MINFIKICLLDATKGLLGNYLQINKEFIGLHQQNLSMEACNLDSKTSLMEIYNLLTNKGFKIAHSNFI